MNPTNQSLSEQNYWQALMARDERADGTFVFAVRSTGVYCRPSCGSRHPKRENVLFFPASKTAEEAGYRPCRRCKPDQVSVQRGSAELVKQICRHIEEDEEHNPSLQRLSTLVGISPHHLQRTFKQVLGITPRQYGDQLRLSLFKSELKRGRSVTDALYDAGYGSSSRLYENAASHLGMTPAAYKRGGKNSMIGYIITGSPLGRMLVAATEKGVCAVRFGDSEKKLEVELRREYPQAGIRRNDSTLRRWVNDLLKHLGGGLPNLNLPLDVQTTAFQRRVWEELRRIPYGTTRSYSQIAEAIGQPKAVRAVARACATNPAAVLIPCHRVVRQDGSAGGYRWGIRRKEFLLRQEQK